MGTGLDLQDRNINFAFNATPGYSYQVQGRVSLTAGAWENIGAPQTATGELIELSANLPEGYKHSGFFRVVVDGE